MYTLYYYQVSPAHLSIELISCLFSFARYLGDAPDGRELLSQLVELLTSDLWTVTSVKVKRNCCVVHISNETTSGCLYTQTTSFS